MIPPRLPLGIYSNFLPNPHLAKSPLSHHPNQPDAQTRRYGMRRQYKCRPARHSTKRRGTNRCYDGAYERVLCVTDDAPEYKDPDEAQGAQEGPRAESGGVRRIGRVRREEVMQILFCGV
jgi:hypothetical protein